MGARYNPLDRENLGISVRDALLKQVPLPMRNLLAKTRPSDKFLGAGIYAIYYTGDFPPYRTVAEQNRESRFDAPIYVGKAVPKGSRKGGSVKSDKPSDALHNRLKNHAVGISEAENLDIADFHFRYLVVDDIWIPLGETYMIDRFRPLWNYIVEGFGIKTPGKRRKGQYTSLWDTLHPGRGFVRQLDLPPNRKSHEQVAADVEKFLTLPPHAKARMPVKDDGDALEDEE